MVRNYKILFLLLLIFNVSCVNNKEGIYDKEKNNEVIKLKEYEIDSIQKEISKVEENIKTYKKLLLPYTVNEPLGLIVCISDPNYYTYLSFYKDSKLEDYYDGPGGSIMNGTWRFERDTIYYKTKQYIKEQKISFSDLLRESQSLKHSFNYCIVDKISENKLDKK